MRALLGAAILVAACCLPVSLVWSATDANLTVCSAEPEQGEIRYRLRELWRVGADDADVLLGWVQRVIRDSESRLLFFDRQTKDVKVFSAAGRFLTEIGILGEGPGETSVPRDLIQRNGGGFGIVDGFPAKVVWLDSGFDPAGVTRPKVDEDGSGMVGMHWARPAGDNVVFAFEQHGMVDGRFSRNMQRKVATLDIEGNILSIHYQDTIPRLQDDHIDERTFFSPYFTWAADRDGRVYCALERDRYLIQITGPDGVVETLFERPYSPLPRSAEELSRQEKQLRGIYRDESRYSFTVGKTHPCIEAMWTDARGLWVEHSRSKRELPDGVLATYDLFSPAGHYLQRVVLLGEADPERDRWFVHEGGILSLILNYEGAARAHRVSQRAAAETSETDDERELEPLQVVIFEMVLAD